MEFLKIKLYMHKLHLSCAYMFGNTLGILVMPGSKGNRKIIKILVSDFFSHLTLA